MGVLVHMPLHRRSATRLFTAKSLGRLGTPTTLSCLPRVQGWMDGTSDWLLVRCSHYFTTK